MLRVLTIAMLIAIGAAAPARAQYFDGNTLHFRCQQERETAMVRWTDCLGYVSGVADVMSGRNAINGVQACIPRGTSRNQLKDVVVDWLRRHPEHRHHNAGGLVAAALAEAYPCR